MINHGDTLRGATYALAGLLQRQPAETWVSAQAIERELAGYSRVGSALWRLRDLGVLHQERRIGGAGGAIVYAFRWRRGSALPCPVCDVSAIYACELDRYVHEDGSANEACWRAMVKGEAPSASPEVPRRETLVSQAEAWVTAYLTEHGPSERRDLIAAGIEAGFSEPTLKRASAAVGVHIAPIPGTHKATRWSLPGLTEPTVRELDYPADPPSVPRRRWRPGHTPADSRSSQEW